MVACIGQNHRTFQKFQRITFYLINSVVCVCVCGGVLPAIKDQTAPTVLLYIIKTREIPTSESKREYKNMRLQSSLFYEYKCNNPT